MNDPDDDLLEPEDLNLSARELSAKALRLTQSIGLGETDEAREAMSAKARAYFRRSGVLQRAERRNDAPPTPIYPLPSELRWRNRHEGMSWERIREEWIRLRSEAESFANSRWSPEQSEVLYELTRLECFIEDFWPNEVEVISVIRADRLAAEATRLRSDPSARE
jgi:hypothetical protein